MCRQAESEQNYIHIITTSSQAIYIATMLLEHSVVKSLVGKAQK